MFLLTFLLNSWRQTDNSPETVTCRKKVEQVDNLIKMEKSLKVQIKSSSAMLHAKTKETIENLTDQQINELLQKKWIEPLVENLDKLLDALIDALVKKLQVLEDKYSTTYSEIQSEIRQTEHDLASMIDELEGNEFDMKGLKCFQALLLGE